MSLLALAFKIIYKLIMRNFNIILSLFTYKYEMFTFLETSNRCCHTCPVSGSELLFHGQSQ